MTKENKKIVKSIDIKAFAWENKNLVDCKAYSAITYLEPRQAEILFLGLYNKYKRD